MAIQVTQSGGRDAAVWPSDSIQTAVRSIQRNPLDFFGGMEVGGSKVPSVMPALERAASRFRAQAVPLRVADGGEGGGGDVGVDGSTSAGGDSIGSSDSVGPADSGSIGSDSGSAGAAGGANGKDGNNGDRGTVDVGGRVSVDVGPVSVEVHGDYHGGCSLIGENGQSGNGPTGNDPGPNSNGP